MTKNNRILHLVIKRKWWDMIESGEKTEEYRDINRLYNRRLHRCRIPHSGKWGDCQDLNGNIICNCYKCFYSDLKDYDSVTFHLGYTNTTMTFEFKGISIGIGNPNWGAPEDEEVFIIKLGKRLYN